MNKEDKSNSNSPALTPKQPLLITSRLCERAKILENVKKQLGTQDYLKSPKEITVTRNILHLDDIIGQTTDITLNVKVYLNIIGTTNST